MPRRPPDANAAKLACVTDLMQQPPPVRLLNRGNYGDFGPAVVPAGLAVLCDGSPELDVKVPYPASRSTGRRLAFARWLTDPDSRASGLLARVMVNRIWQRHFGTGIVATPDNFGLSGSPPTHPELLEYLADAFRQSGWSVKAVHRLILLSATYQQSSAARNDALAADPNDRLLWRYPLVRLDAEALHDAMLAVSGELSDRLYGPYVPTERGDDGSVVVSDGQEGGLPPGNLLAAAPHAGRHDSGIIRRAGDRQQLSRPQHVDGPLAVAGLVEFGLRPQPRGGLRGDGPRLELRQGTVLPTASAARSQRHSDASRRRGNSGPRFNSCGNRPTDITRRKPPPNGRGAISARCCWPATRFCMSSETPETTRALGLDLRSQNRILRDDFHEAGFQRLRASAAGCFWRTTPAGSVFSRWRICSRTKSARRPCRVVAIRWHRCRPIMSRGPNR